MTSGLVEYGGKRGRDVKLRRDGVAGMAAWLGEMGGSGEKGKNGGQ